MSFIHNTSSECAKEQLDIFAVPPTQLSIEHAEILSFKPVATLEGDSVIEFVVPPASEEYTDVFNTYLYMVMSITNEKGAPTSATDKVATINNALHSCFSDVNVTVGNKTISTSSHLYPYKAYLENLFNYNETAKETHQTLALYYKDTAGKFNDMKETNEGYFKRESFFTNGKKTPLYGRLSMDLFGQNKYLINGVGLNISFTRSSNSFFLMADGATFFKTKIESATLFVRRVKPSPDLLIAHAKVLAKTTAKYPISRVEVKTFTIPSTLQSYSLDNIITGQLPVRIIIGFVSNAALNGNYKQNPFNFQHFQLSYLSLMKDGVAVQSGPFLPKFTGSSPDYALSYFSTFVGVGIHTKDDGYGISRSEYPDGYCLHAWDLTNDQSADIHQWSLRKTGTIGVDFRFESAIASPLSCIVYSEFQSLIEIDSDRRVTTDY